MRERLSFLEPCHDRVTIQAQDQRGRSLENFCSDTKAIKCALLIVLATTLWGCSTSFHGASSQSAGVDEESLALKYFLPEDAVEVVVNLERVSARRLKRREDGTIFIEPTNTIRPKGATVNLMTVPDKTKEFLLDANASNLRTNNTAFAVSEIGLLQSVNAQTSGAAGIVVEQALRVVGTALPIIDLTSGNAIISAATTAAPSPQDLTGSADLLDEAISGSNLEASLINAELGEGSISTVVDLVRAGIAEAATNDGSRQFPTGVLRQLGSGVGGGEIDLGDGRLATLSLEVIRKSMDITQEKIEEYQQDRDEEFRRVREQVAGDGIVPFRFDPENATASILTFESELAITDAAVALPDGECTTETIVSEFFAGSIEVEFAFGGLLPNQKQLTQTFCTTLQSVEARRESYKAALIEFEASNNQQELRVRDLKLRRLRSEFDLAVGRHRDARAEILASVGQVLVKAGVATKRETFTRKAIFRLTELPSSSEVSKTIVRTGDSNLPGKLKVVGLRIKDGKEFASDEPYSDFFKQTGLLVSVDELQEKPQGEAGARQEATENSQQNMPTAAESVCKAKKLPCVFYRSPRPYLLSTWIVSKPDVSLTKLDSQLVTAISGAEPIIGIELRDSNWTKRNSTLTFSARGRLTGLTRDDGSAAADASLAVANGLTGGLSAYQSALSSVQTIRTTQNALDLLPLQQGLAVAQAEAALELQPEQARLLQLQTQLQQAQAELNLLTAQTDLEASTQRRADLLNTAMLDIQNGLLFAQGQLNTQQAQNRDQASAAQVAAAASLLQSQIIQVQNQISLLELQRQLSELESQSE